MIWKTRKGQKGFTLVELMIVVAIIGVLATLAVYGVRRYIANAKSAEARATVGQIGKLAAAAYERESGTTSVVTIGEASATNRNLCAAATAVPTSLDSVRNKKYQSQISDWGGSQTAGWRCLRFTMDGPQYYQYQYTLPSDSTFKASATGDLDGNSKNSEFSLAGSVIEGQVRLAPTIAETDPEE